MKKLLIGTIIIGALGLAGCASTNAISEPSHDTSKTLEVSHISQDANVKTYAEAMNLLKAGNQRFISDKSEVVNVNSARRKELEKGQHPYATVISCSDSRVTPALVFNSGLGDIFDIRLAGNVVDDDALGSVEYAVEHLHTPVIIVMGHENCGGVTAAYNQVVKGEMAHGHVEDLVDEIEESINKNQTLDQAIRSNVNYVVAEVKKDPVVATAIKNGQVKVIGAYYDLDGKVTFNA